MLPFDFHFQNFKKAVSYFLIAYFFITLTYTFSTLASSTASTSSMVFFRNLIGLLFTLPWMIKHRSSGFKVAKPGVLVLRSSLGILGIFFVFLAVRHVSLVDVTLLSNTAPLFVPFLGWFFLKQPIDHKGWPALILGFIGIALILVPTKGIFNVHALYALANGITTAATFLVVRLAAKTEKMQTLLFYYYLIGLVLFLPFNIIFFQVPDLLTLFYLILVGATAYYGSAFSFYALQYGKTADLAPFSYSGVIYAGILEWIIWGQVPQWINLIGVVLTCSAGIYILHLNRPSANTPKMN
jgi:drug/metabolite transporter (DMT)-like permease